MAFQFIPPNEVIKHLRTKMPIFANRIAGGAQYDVFEDDTKIPKPAAFIMLGNNNAETLSNNSGLTQRISHSFDIVLYLDPVDLRKQEAEDISVAFKKDLIRYLNGWKPTGYEHSSPLEFVGDQLQDTAADMYSRVFQFVQYVDFDSSLDGEGEIGNLDDLYDFDTLIGPFTVGDGDTKDVDVRLVDIHE